mmetsp:Transcript_7804/g.16077  ORF Transcript_7804/g.16077 Transcript_7804/m.16077 type:complete len:115 (-) Transcript_7804:277-621(-)
MSSSSSARATSGANRAASDEDPTRAAAPFEEHSAKKDRLDGDDSSLIALFALASMGIDGDRGCCCQAEATRDTKKKMQAESDHIETREGRRIRLVDEGPMTDELVKLMALETRR